jgi:DNA-binding CsgD family transcriptional regulator
MSQQLKSVYGGELPMVSEAGVLLVDLSLRVVAFDEGAVAILRQPDKLGEYRDVRDCIPREITELVRKQGAAGARTAAVTYFKIRETRYACRGFWMKPDNGWSQQPIVALHIERNRSMTDTLQQLSGEYHLTSREQEALSGVLAGLSSKELAGQMRISPNTVKAFLRLIMIKMGVSTRVELLAKILRRNVSPQKSSAASTVNSGASAPDSGGLYAPQK